jgi:hypothetical protein
MTTPRDYEQKANPLTKENDESIKKNINILDA